MAAVVLETKDIEKHFVIDIPFPRIFLNPFAARQKTYALMGITFEIEAGKILGIVGPNGAGKTTLLRILADVLMPDKGKVTICGNEAGIAGWHLRNKVGYASSDERSFFWRLTGRENLDFFGKLYGLSTHEAYRQSTRLLEAFGLERKAEQLFRDYSSGIRKKFAVMRALLHQPQVVLLDEVTNSLDPASAKTVKAMVREYVSCHQGRVAIWSTHRLEEIAEICDEVIVIESGLIRFHGSANNFQVVN